VSVSTCGGLIHGGAYIRGGGLIVGGLRYIRLYTIYRYIYYFVAC
jgi:hypothetical protein